MISKEKITFDPTDADSLAASDVVGARLLVDDGTSPITGGDGSADNLATSFQGVDARGFNYLFDGTNWDRLRGTSGAVHINDGGNSITVDAVDLDIRDLTQTDEITVYQGTSPWVIGDGGGSITVDAVDLDIRDLAFATDSVDVSGSEVSLDAATLAALETITVLQGTSPWVIGDGGGSITVDAVDLDIRDLDAAQDSVAAWTHDGTGNAITSTTGWLDVNIAGSDVEINVEDDKANTALLSTANSIGDTAEALLASQLAARRFLWVQNLGPAAMYVGDSSVTTTTGIRFSNGAIGEFRFGPGISLYAITPTGATADARMLEAS